LKTGKNLLDVATKLDSHSVLYTTFPSNTSQQ